METCGQTNENPAAICVTLCVTQHVKMRFQTKCRFGIRKPPFYPLNYGNNGSFDFRFAIADCKQQTDSRNRYCRDCATAWMLSRTGNYAAIQRLVLRQDAICRELFERAIATVITQFARQLRRLDQLVQSGSRRGYIPERI